MASESDIRALKQRFLSATLPLDGSIFQEFLKSKLFVAVSPKHAIREQLLFQTIKSQGISKIVCFSSAAIASQWSVKRIIPIEIALGELLALLPQKYGLILDPDSDTSKIVQKPVLRFSDEVNEAPNTPKFSAKSGINFEEALKNDLIDSCKRFSQVEEAYFLYRPDDNLYPVVLGLLCSGVHSEQRYDLTELIAELSKEYFNSPSAIEVFDDLDVRNSHTWELFRTLLPIYTACHFKLEYQS